MEQTLKNINHEIRDHEHGTHDTTRAGNSLGLTCLLPEPERPNQLIGKPTRSITRRPTGTQLVLPISFRVFQ